MREYRLIDRAIESFGLDLRGLRILTEAASGPFLWTALLAARAGAEQVRAIGADSRFGSFDDVARETRKHAKALQVEQRLELREGRSPSDAEGCQIVTNLGFVRPIDAATVAALPDRAVVCLMWEPWEFREEDVDWQACRARGIPVLGTNERDPRLGTFEHVGMVVVRLLLDEGIEIRGSRIALLGSGPFAEAAERILLGLGAEVGNAPRSELDGTYDAVVCLEHHDREQLLVGPGGLVSRPELTRSLLHVCGRIDLDWAREQGWQVVPSSPAAPGWMSFSTAHIGPRPVIDLHAAGLRIGQAWSHDEPEVLDRLALPVDQAVLDRLAVPAQLP